MDELDVRIVVFQAGWIAVGAYRRDGEMIRVNNPKIIRRWGTSRGLGELTNGPLAETKLDEGGEDIEAHILTIVMIIRCSAKGWKKVLKL